MELENKMLIDGYWLDYGAKDEEENEYDWLEQIEEEELDEDAAYIAEHGWGRANGYVL
jgi:hypothetical protein